MHGQSDSSIADQVEAVSGARPSIAFYPFDDLVSSVTEDVSIVRSCPFLPPGTVVWGAYYDVATGSLITVGEPATVLPTTSAPADAPRSGSAA